MKGIDGGIGAFTYQDSVVVVVVKLEGGAGADDGNPHEDEDEETLPQLLKSGVGACVCDLNLQGALVDDSITVVAAVHRGLSRVSAEDVHIMSYLLNNHS